MRSSQLFSPTRKEDPADAEVASHQLLIRAGYIRMVSRGIYTFLPLGWRSVRKIEQIVREEMDRAGAQEIRMPGVQPAELWQESGRWEKYGVELLRFHDRKGGEFALGPTHEEVVTDLVRHDITSYKQLPVTLYQMQTKFRDEARPRFGLMRGREFIMKDAYSFDLSVEGALKSYDMMYEAYTRIFDRMGFNWRAVEADTGNIGGDRSHEFQVLAETGEDRIVSCPSCGYAANVEKAEITLDVTERAADAVFSDVEEIATPGAKTIDEITSFLGVGPEALIKTLIFVADGEPLAVLVRGDYEVNEVKVKALLADLEGFGAGVKVLELADDALVGKLTKAPVGFAGPVGLSIPIVADLSVQPMVDAIVGANKKDAHLKGVNHGRDFQVARFADVRMAQSGDRCGRCEDGILEEMRGIEVGHVFYLGTTYSEAMGATLQDETGQLKPMEMGCYGIGITRILAAAVEQGHDDDGMILPTPIAPFEVVVLPLQQRKEAVAEAGESIYSALKAAGIDALLDDRDARAGHKFKDADLMGIPLRVAIGARGLEEGHVELKARAGGEVELISVDDIVAHVTALVEAAR